MWAMGSGRAVEKGCGLLLNPGTGCRGRVLLSANGRTGRAGQGWQFALDSTIHTQPPSIICAAA